MTSNSIRKYLMTAAITVACSSAALGQNKSTEGIDWMQELKSRITINGYMQGGYEYSDKGGNTTSSFNFKRAIFWGRARITDRWSFMFMNNFALSKGVLEFWTDYRTQPHMPSSSLSAFFTVESPVKKSTGLPGLRSTCHWSATTFCIICCRGFRAGFWL